MKKKVISTLATCILALSSTTFAYNDVEGHWVKPYVDDLKSIHMLEQYKDSNLYPDQYMTREECAVLLSDLLEAKYGYEPTYRKELYKFTDLNDNENSEKINALSLLTYRSYMSAKKTNYLGADELKIIEGYPSTGNSVEFRPNNLITRAEFTKMVFSSLDCFGYISITNTPVIASDAELHWGGYFLDVAYSVNILNGYSTSYGDYTAKVKALDGSIREGKTDRYVVYKPDENITRAEAIKMIARHDPYMIKFYGLSESGTRAMGEKVLYYLK